ncbi:transcriptional regulator [Curtobacterium sp. VKM Ac-1376]|uniref:transcriptional regulator n=1 Tax=Curtobacterium sp. VKM Ac-1376 TaxID=123312 RepID=UPI001889E7AD|nr:transcriptional regulator [Curtobacterium sp. VKM Ac-1376]MBF4613119.1 transcriptional regulator [Curtobacterium sp. VKM Ac-1376]
MTPGPHPRHELDDRVHSPVRFSLLALLRTVDEAEFRAVRDALEVSDSTLSQAATVLRDADFVTVRRLRVGRSTRSWLAITDNGRVAFEHHLTVLRTIAESHST